MKPTTSQIQRKMNSKPFEIYFVVGLSHCTLGFIDIFNSHCLKVLSYGIIWKNDKEKRNINNNNKNKNEKLEETNESQSVSRNLLDTVKSTFVYM